MLGYAPRAIDILNGRREPSIGNNRRLHATRRIPVEAPIGA